MHGPCYLLPKALSLIRSGKLRMSDEPDSLVLRYLRRIDERMDRMETRLRLLTRDFQWDRMDRIFLQAS